MISNEWTELFPRAAGSMAADPVRVSMIKKDKDKRARCRLNLSSEIVQTIGAMGGKVKVRLGYGENAGCLQIIADGGGPFRLRAVSNKCAGGRRPNGRFDLLLPVVAGFADITTKIQPAKHRTVPIGAMKALIVDLPRALWATGEKR